MKTIINLTLLTALLFLVGCETKNLAEPEFQIRCQGVTYELMAVLDKSLEKCRSVQGGHYEMESAMKYMSDQDTARSYIVCDFKRVPDDNIFEQHFSHTVHVKDGVFHTLYTGKELVRYDDTSGIVYPKEVLQSYSFGVDFFRPISDQHCFPVDAKFALADSGYVFSMTDTVINGKPCCHVSYVTSVPDTLFDLDIICIRYAVDVWIDTVDFLPIRYDERIDDVQGLDTMVQYRSYTLKSFSPMWDESLLTMESIPPQTKLEMCAEEESVIKPLAKGSMAPLWTLPSLDGDTVRLADLKGKVVLIDFFYKSCGPCMAAVPILQRLHEKYKDHGFVMIGIDPYDDPQEDEMADFMSKRGASYKVLFSDRDLPATYRVAAFPTLYLINPQGKIAFVEQGYSKDMEQGLEKQIKKLL